MGGAGVHEPAHRGPQPILPRGDESFDEQRASAVGEGHAQMIEEARAQDAVEVSVDLGVVRLHEQDGLRALRNLSAKLEGRAKTARACATREDALPGRVARHERGRGVHSEDQRGVPARVTCSRTSAYAPSAYTTGTDARGRALFGCPGTITDCAATSTVMPRRRSRFDPRTASMCGLPRPVAQNIEAL